MGCAASLIGELTGVEIPEIDIDLGAVKDVLTGLMGPIPENIAENTINFTSECANLETGQEYEVPDTTMKLHKDSSEKEIVAAAVLTSCSSAVRDQIKDAVWACAEPLIDEALAAATAEAPAPIPDFILGKAKDKFREAIVDPLVDKAIDKAMETAMKKNGASAEEIAECQSSTASKKKPKSLETELQKHTEQTGTWTYGLCGCFGDCCSCLKAWCCYPCVSACIYKQAELGNCCCALWPCCWVPICGCHACCVTKKLREKKGIKGGCFGDWCTFLFCPFCQLTRELREARGT